MMEFIVKYWLEFALGLCGVGVTSAIGWAVGRFYKGKNVRQGIQALLRAQIIQQYNRCQDKEYCPIYALENVHALYKEYKALGGNGAITALVEELEKMPTRRPGGAGGSEQRRDTQQ